MNHSPIQVRHCLLAVTLLASPASFASPAADQTLSAPPDFTQGGHRDDNHDWRLGPTGMNGWIFGKNGQTAEARQILVTAVETGSPADGVMQSGDVILGVGGQRFTHDARIEYARAITAAEQEKNAGALELIRWRSGTTENVKLKLAVMGSYADTAPYGCGKSKKIFEHGCQLIAKNGLKGTGIDTDLNALALLASGNKEYLPMLADYTKKVAASLKPGAWMWFYGYGNTFLAEYILATGDKSILPELKRTTMEAVKAQCMNGMWGHNASLPDGHSEGYGGMNSVGLPMTIALVLARQAGVKDPAVDKAIERSVVLLRWYVNKGAIPYGDHNPWPGHEDNGKCSNAAVLFDILGDRDATSFYSRMAMAGYSERERGHTGNFFNILWALPAVTRCGPLAAGTYLKEQSWYYDLNRGWDGGFNYQGSPVGEEEHKKYTRWDCTGAYLLSYAAPLKSLYLIGKKPCSVPPLNQAEADDVIAAGRDYFAPSGTRGGAYEGRTPAQLLAGLASWSPAVRKRSCLALATCEGDFVPALLKMLAGSSRYARYGACEALGALGPKSDPAAPQLRALLKDPDPWLRYLTCLTLPQLGPEARNGSIHDLLLQATVKNPADPRGTVNRTVSIALFSPYPGSRGHSILADSLDGVDRAMLYPAIRAVLGNDDGAARGSLSHIYTKLTDRDIAALLPDIVKAIQVMAPSDEMFADGIRLAGLDLLSRLHIREGMDLCVSTMESRWGNDHKRRLEYLKRYGSHAKAVLPQLRLKRPKSGSDASDFDNSLASIEASTDTPALVSMKDFIARASAGGNTSTRGRQNKP